VLLPLARVSEDAPDEVLCFHGLRVMILDDKTLVEAFLGSLLVTAPAGSGAW
jgi:hypothetical protein